MRWHFLAVKEKILNTFPEQWIIIRRSASGETVCAVLQSVEKQRAERGRERLVPFYLIKKKMQGKKQLRTSDSTYLSQNEIQTESHAVI